MQIKHMLAVCNKNYCININYHTDGTNFYFETRIRSISTKKQIKPFTSILTKNLPHYYNKNATYLFRKNVKFCINLKVNSIKQCQVPFFLSSATSMYSMLVYCLHLMVYCIHRCLGTEHPPSPDILGMCSFCLFSLSKKNVQPIYTAY